MDIGEIIGTALPVIYILVGAALVWFVVELIVTVRRTRKTVDDLQKRLEPTLASVERISASLEPVASKVDPLVERVSLTVDAANLEIMRVDKILEDVGDVTDSASSAVDAVDTVVNAPVELVNTVANRVRGLFKTRRASDESIGLGKEKAKQVGPAADADRLDPSGKSPDTAGRDIPDAAADTVSPEGDTAGEYFTYEGSDRETEAKPGSQTD